MKFFRNEENDKGEWAEDKDQITQLKANFIISAFGSGLYDEDGRKSILKKIKSI